MLGRRGGGKSVLGRRNFGGGTNVETIAVLDPNYYKEIGLLLFNEAKEVYVWNSWDSLGPQQVLP